MNYLIEKIKKIYLSHTEGILYLIFGFLTTVIYLGTYTILINDNVHYLISTNIAFVLAFLFAFFTNRHIVFKKGSNILKEITLFLGARLATQFINNIGLVILIESLHMGKLISQIILQVVVVLLNYIISKRAIFV